MDDDLRSCIRYLESQLKAERERSAILAATCDAWARAFGTRSARRANAQATRADVLRTFADAQPQVAGGAERRAPLPDVNARSHGFDDGEGPRTYAEFLEQRLAGRRE